MTDLRHPTEATIRGLSERMIADRLALEKHHQQLVRDGQMSIDDYIVRIAGYPHHVERLRPMFEAVIWGKPRPPESHQSPTPAKEG